MKRDAVIVGGRGSGLPAVVDGPLSGGEPRLGMGIGWLLVFGSVVVVVFFGGFGAWSWLAPLESAAIAPGVLGVEGERKTVAHLEGGIVQEILVSEGERVSAGDTLLVLDATRARAGLALLEGQYRSALALEARLRAEGAGSAEIEWPAALLDTAHPEAFEMRLTQGRIFEARAASFATRRSIYERQVGQLREEALGIESEIGFQDRSLMLLEEELVGIRALVERGLESKARLLALERRAAQVGGLQARNRARLARIAQGIGETRLKMTELDNGRLKEVTGELREVERRLSGLRERLALARDVLGRTRVVAPVSGTVVALRVFTRGGVVRAGEPLLELVPSEASLIVKARVSPADIDAVSSGLSAQVRLTSFSRLTTPPFTGRVVGVSADRFTDEVRGTAWYETRIELASEQSGLAAYELVPGMPAEVVIITGLRTPLEYLLKPVLASLNRSLREE